MDKIIGGNRLIAKFMGYSKIEKTSALTDDTKELWIENKDAEPDKRIIQGTPKYHSSWDLLMPVYIKIVNSELYGNSDTGISLFNIMYERIGDADGIENVWESIIEFIKWYNTQKK